VTTPPNDPNQPAGGPPAQGPPYGYGDKYSDPAYGQYPAGGAPSGWEGATNGFGGPFIPPDPIDLSKEQSGRAPAPGAAAQNPYGQSPYGQTPWAQQPGQNPYGQQQYAQPGPNPYGQNPYGQNPYGPGVPPYYPQAAPNNGIATAGMVLGIISIPFALGSFFDLPVAIVGFILAMVGFRRAKSHGGATGKAVTGIICSIVGFVFAVGMSVYVVNEINRCTQYGDIGTSSFSNCISSEEYR
jgi:hypothetical protein